MTTQRVQSAVQSFPFGASRAAVSVGTPLTVFASDGSRRFAIKPDKGDGFAPVVVCKNQGLLIQLRILTGLNSFPSGVLSRFKALANALSLLPPTTSPSFLIRRRAASNTSVSAVFTHQLMSPATRESTSGTKSYPKPSTMQDEPALLVARISGRARALPS